MSARAESLAKQFEARAAEMTAIIEKLSEADWKKVTSAERWSVGVTAHHVAEWHEAGAGVVKTLAGGQSVPEFTTAMVDEMNAKHAREHANCSKAETLALHKTGAATAAAVIRGLSDPELDMSGTVITGTPPMTAQRLIEDELINHIDEHLRSIRATVGH